VLSEQRRECIPRQWMVIHDEQSRPHALGYRPHPRCRLVPM
jgi:hypothetical protein